MADRLVQHHARPAGTEHHIELAGRCGDGFEIDQRLTHSVIDRALPFAGLDEALIALAPAVSMAAGLLPIACARDHGDIDAHQRPHVAVGLAVRAQDFHHLPRRAERHRYLPHARVLGARERIDLFQQLHLGFERRRTERVVVAVKPYVRPRRRLRVAARVAALHGTHGNDCTLDRLLGDIRGMRVTDRLAFHGAQAEALRGVVGRLLQPAVVEHQRLGLPVFEEQLAVIGAFKPAAEQFCHASAIELCAVEQGGRRVGHRAIPHEWVRANIGAATLIREGCRWCRRGPFATIAARPKAVSKRGGKS